LGPRNTQANREASGGDGSAKMPTGRARIKLLYEEYIHLPLLRQASFCF
jgi:hypothetical protein